MPPPPAATLLSSWAPYDWREQSSEASDVSSDWREAIRSKVKEETTLRLARAESPSWRSRLEAVKAQMEDSSLKVELAEQEMRRAVKEMRHEQKLSTVQAGARQRSMAEMQELIHGLREEQQQAQRALAVCQQALRAARSVAAVQLMRALHRHALTAACLQWWHAARQMAVGGARDEARRAGLALAQEEARTEQLRARLRSGAAELEQLQGSSRSLQGKVVDLQVRARAPLPCAMRHAPHHAPCAASYATHHAAPGLAPQPVLTTLATHRPYLTASPPTAHAHAPPVATPQRHRRASSDARRRPPPRRRRRGGGSWRRCARSTRTRCRRRARSTSRCRAARGTARRRARLGR